MCCPGAIQLCSGVSWRVLLCCVDLSAIACVVVFQCADVMCYCVPSCLVVAWCVAVVVLLWSVVVCCVCYVVVCCVMLCSGFAFCCRVVVVLCFVSCVCPGAFHCVPPRCVCTRHATVRHATFGGGQRAVGGEGMAKGNLATGN